jgi:hypothetical protein
MVSTWKSRMLSTDFWWLSPKELRQYGYIDLFYQKPCSDEPNTYKDPYSCPILQSDKRCPLESVSHWQEKYNNTNIFRSFALYSSDTNGVKLIGPFLLDIDRVIMKDGGYVAQLHKALEDARLIVEEYCANLKSEDYRIFFTGHKGFHIEISPRALNIPSRNRHYHFESRRKEINKRFGNSFVDKFHDHVRFHNSINSWIDYSGRLVSTMIFEMSSDDLFGLSVEAICAKGKKLALRYLNS